MPSLLILFGLLINIWSCDALTFIFDKATQTIEIRPDMNLFNILQQIDTFPGDINAIIASYRPQSWVIHKGIKLLDMNGEKKNSALYEITNLQIGDSVAEKDTQIWTKTSTLSEVLFPPQYITKSDDWTPEEFMNWLNSGTVYVIDDDKMFKIVPDGQHYGIQWKADAHHAKVDGYGKLLSNNYYYDDMTWYQPKRVSKHVTIHRKRPYWYRYN